MMKGGLMRRFLIILFATLLFQNPSFSQMQALPRQQLLTPEGEKVSSSSILPEGSPLLLVFWNAENKECCKQMEAMVNARDDYLKGYQVKLVSIFVAEAGQLPLLRPLLAGKGWEVEAYFDVNAALAQAMCIPAYPFTILYDAGMSKVCAHIGFCTGAEDLICEKVKKCMETTP